MPERWRQEIQEFKAAQFREGFQLEMSVNQPDLLKQQGQEKEDVVVFPICLLSVFKVPWDSVTYKNKETGHIPTGLQ